MNEDQNLIACLEGEISKRDARISELEDLGAEWVNKALAYSAELSAIKAQEPVAWICGPDSDGVAIDYRPCDLDGLPIGTKLYAAPVSEAKAQGVVMPERMDIPGVQADFYGSSALDEVARLNAAPVQHGSLNPDHVHPSELGRARVASAMANCLIGAAPIQQVSVPDGWKLVPVNATEAILDVLYSNGMDESDSLLQDIWSAMLAAAPAAPAADAGLVEALEASNMLLRTKRHACENEQVCHVLDVHIKRNTAALAAHRAKEGE